MRNPPARTQRVARALATTAGTPEPPRLLAMDEAIAALATTRPTFYRWLRAGTISGIKVGRQWRFRPADIERFLAGKGPRVELPGDIKPLIVVLSDRLGKAAAAVEGDPIGRAVALMILGAQRDGASDLHLSGYSAEPGAALVGHLRARVDGALREVADFDVRLLPLLVEEWKRLAGMDPATDVVQEGWIRARGAAGELDLRVTVVPTTTGASVTARFIDAKSAVPSFDRFDLTTRDRQAIDRALKTPQALTLFTGPLGSGKTTSLLAALAQSAAAAVKVMLVDESIACHVPRVVQLQPGRGLTTAAALHGCIASDTDVVGIGEIADGETMRAALECLAMGQTVVACSYCGSAASALRRMLELGGGDVRGVEDLKLVVSQRLVRRVCPHCAVGDAPNGALRRKLQIIASAGGLPAAELQGDWKSSRGCARCRGTGTRGRIVILEAMEVTSELRQALARGAGDDELRSIAIGQGMTSMVADGLRKASAGVVSLVELQRWFPDAIALG